MKQFIKMTLATVVGICIAGAVAVFLMTAVLVGAIAAFDSSQPVIPSKAVLQIDMSAMMLAEQTKEADPVVSLQSSQVIAPVGIYSAVRAINAAAVDPAVKFIYMKPDAALGGFAQIEELRKALLNFRSSGKAIVSYIENPTNAGYYLASVSDKIYMTSYNGGMNMFTGVSTQLIFLKDILDRLGVNVQLIRHGKYKSAGEMFVRSNSSKENMDQNEAMIKSVWNSWAAEIADSRGISVADLNGMLDNLELNFPSDFLEKRLVDDLFTREELQKQLCVLYGAEKFKDVKAVQLPDYAKFKSVANFADKKVAVIYVEGNMVEGPDKQQVAGDRFAKIISEIRDDEAVKAVVLRVNSPGGSVFTAEKIKTEIGLVQEKGIPVIASFGDYAASGGYWISAGCDKIYADATTFTGSIGVFSMIPDLSGTLKNKLHINVTPVNSNRHGDMYNMLRPFDKAELAYMQASVEKIYNTFTEVVAQGREMTVEEVDEIAQGRVWTGAEALEIGLVDEIGTLEDAINYAVLSIEGAAGLGDIQVEEYPKPLTTLELLMESLGGTSQNVFTGTPLESVSEAMLDWTSSESGRVYARMPFELSIR